MACFPAAPQMLSFSALRGCCCFLNFPPLRIPPPLYVLNSEARRLGFFFFFNVCFLLLQFGSWGVQRFPHSTVLKLEAAPPQLGGRNESQGKLTGRQQRGVTETSLLLLAPSHPSSPATPCFSVFGTLTQFIHLQALLSHSHTLQRPPSLCYL